MKLKITKDDGKKPKLKGDTQTTTQYGKYNGIVDKTGKTVDKPTTSEAVVNMANYMKNNNPESNVYRPEYSHLGIVYKKKNQSGA